MPLMCDFLSNAFGCEIMLLSRLLRLLPCSSSSIGISPGLLEKASATTEERRRSRCCISTSVVTADTDSRISAKDSSPAGSVTSDTAEDAFLPPGFKSTLAKGLRRLACSNIFVGPNASLGPMSEVEFIKSSTKEQDCPRDGFPEFALVGRSNVGKSSLINALVRRRHLAKTSKTPGKTQVINHFLIDKSWYLVDLPGYGYAKAPTNIRVDWDNFTKDYFLKRNTLVSVLLLVDASVSPKQTDLDYADWLGSNKIPITVVFTKCDKRRRRNRRTPQENVQEFIQRLKNYLNKVPPWIMTSCMANQGRVELLIHLAQLRNYWRS